MTEFNYNVHSKIINIKKVRLKCRYCGAQFLVKKKDNLDNKVKRLECNWCVNCHNYSEGPYEEYRIYFNKNQFKESKILGDNQLKLL